MRIWLIQMGELLHSDGPGTRLYRLGLLANALEARGHNVVRWAPTFMHTHKKQRFDVDTTINITPRYEIHHIFAPGYRKDRGVERIRFHRQVARRWEVLQRDLPAPDLLLTSMPTPEICVAARRVCAQRKIPFVIDVRDLWPDVLYQAMPSWAGWAARLLAAPIALGNRRSFRAATGITAVSRSYLDWGLNLAGRPESTFDRVFPPAYEPPEATKASVEAAEASWRSRLPSGAFICLFLGTMSKQFDLVTVLEAARRLEKSYPGRFEWVLSGDGPARPALVRAARDLPNVRFPGWVDGPEVVALLRLAAVGLAPYAAGVLMSLPNKPFEYAWAGLPVVSSLAGEFASLLERERFGCDYPPGDAPVLARIIGAYEEDPELRRNHGQSGRRVWEEQFSAGHVYSSMVGFLEELAGVAGER